MNISNLSIQILILLLMVYDCKEIQFLDLTVYVENGSLKQKFFLSLQTTTSIWMHGHCTNRQYLDPFQEQWPKELHPHIILLLVKYTKLFTKILDQQWTLVNNLRKFYC